MAGGVTFTQSAPAPQNRISGSTGQVTLQGFFGLPSYVDADFLNRLNSKQTQTGRQGGCYFSSAGGAMADRSAVIINQVMVRFNNRLRSDKDGVLKGITSLTGIDGTEIGLGNLQLIEQKLQALNWSQDQIDNIITETVANAAHIVGIAREDVPYQEGMKWNARAFAAQQIGASSFINISFETIRQGARLETFVLSKTQYNQLDWEALKRYHEIKRGQHIIGLREQRDSTVVSYLNGLLAQYVQSPGTFFDLHGANSLIQIGTTASVHTLEIALKVKALLFMYGVLKGLNMTLVPLADFDDQSNMLVDALGAERQPNFMSDFVDNGTGGRVSEDSIENEKRGAAGIGRQYDFSVNNNTRFSQLRRFFYATDQGNNRYRAAREGDDFQNITFLGEPEWIVCHLAQIVGVLPAADPRYESNNIFGSIITEEKARAAIDPEVYQEQVRMAEFEEYINHIMHGTADSQYDFGDVEQYSGQPDIESAYLRNIAKVDDGVNTAPNSKTNAGKFLMLQQEVVSMLNTSFAQFEAIRRNRSCGTAMKTIEHGHIGAVFMEGVGRSATGY